MPTPIGHSLMGGLLYQGIWGGQKRWKMLLLVLFVANLADFDFIPGILIGKPNIFHHGFSHSLGAALCVGLVCGLIFKLVYQESFMSGFLIFGGVYLSHIIMDFVAVDTSPPYGAPMLWPFSSQYYLSPIQIFSDVYRGSTNETFIFGLFTLHNMWTIFREIAILVPLASLVIWIRKKVTTPVSRFPVKTK